ncbi:heme exporter protein CcmB [Novimethylophilus kurashikiensis]|nr:heme exporter protein CcmB [Novimethylophilus kurashikiensis]
MLRCLLWRDLQLVVRRKSDAVAALFFFIIATSLFPLGVGSEPALLRAVGPGVLWVAALLSAMLSLNRLFAADHADGSLEQLVLMPVPLTLTVAVKTLAHWLTSGLPLVLLAPLLGLQFDLAGDALAVLTLSLLLGTPLLSLIGAIGAALTLGVRGGGVLLAVLVLPLYIPVLIFGAGAVSACAHGMSPWGGLSLLGALLVLGVVFAPFAAAAALRVSLE